MATAIGTTLIQSSLLSYYNILGDCTLTHIHLLGSSSLFEQDVVAVFAFLTLGLDVRVDDEQPEFRLLFYDH